MEHHDRKPKPALQRNVPSAHKSHATEPESIEEILSLTSSADVRSFSAEKMIALSRLIGNQALQRSVSSAQTTTKINQTSRLQIDWSSATPLIQRMVFDTLPRTDQQSIKLKLQGMAGKKWKEPNPKKWEEVVIWANNVPQALAILDNLSLAEFDELKRILPKGGKVIAEYTTAQRLKEYIAWYKKKEAEEAAAAKYKADNPLLYYPPPTDLMTQAVNAGDIRLEHIETFRTVNEKTEKRGKTKGPCTREYNVYYKNTKAGYVYHAHFRVLDENSIPAGHFKESGSGSDRRDIFINPTIAGIAANAREKAKDLLYGNVRDGFTVAEINALNVFYG